MKNPDLSRRRFLASSAIAAGTIPILGTQAFSQSTASKKQKTKMELPAPGNYPVRVIASANGLEATKKAYNSILNGEDTLDAVISGVNLVEDDPEDMSVGLGGLPNEEGVVELDSAVMHGPTHRAGAVAALRNIRNPSKVAKMVLELTDHVLLVGEGALKFAKAMGFPEENLLTENARVVWLDWKRNLSKEDDWLSPGEAIPLPNDKQSKEIRPTGTIHCAGMNQNGDISCVTTTSGLAFKIPGRVGDSPIIGAGLYADNEIGSCGSTGRGEANLQNLCSFLAIELMGNGMSPSDAGMEVLRRVARHTKEKHLLNDKGNPNFGLMFYLLAKDGGYAGVSMYGPAKFAVTDAQGTRHEECEYLFKHS